MGEPVASWVPAGGLVRVTSLAATVFDDSVASVGCSPSWVSWLRAADGLWLTRLGTVTVGRPVDTAMLTVAPLAAAWPAGGLELTTTPAGTVELLTLLVVTTNPCCWSWAWAAPSCSPTTLGTFTVPGPPLISSTIAWVFGATLPGLGCEVTTSPTATVALV